MIPLAADLNELALGIFALVVAITLGITYWASKRDPLGHRVLGRRARHHRRPERLRDRRRLHVGRVVPRHRRPDLPVRLRRRSCTPIGFLVAFLTVLFLLAERMRNAGKYTIADVLVVPPATQRPARAAAALGTLAVVAFYLIAQMVGAGVLIQALVGHRLLARGDRHRRVHALLRRLRRHARHDLGADHQGRAAAWSGRPVLTVFVLDQGRLEPDRAVQPRPRRGRRTARPTSSRALFLPKPIDTVSLGLALRARHRRPAAHPHALLHRARREGRARSASSGRCS